MEQFRLDSDEWLGIVRRLGGAERLTATARAHKAFLRSREVKSATDLLRLALMYGPGGQSLRVLAASAGADGVATLSDVALLNRLRGAADWLQALCVESLTGSARGAAEIGAARPIRIVDGSRLTGPGKRAWRLHLSYDPCAGRLVEAQITTLQHGDRLDRLGVQPGEIRLADRGFPQPGGLRNVLEAGADVVMRLTWNSLSLADAQGEPIDWLAMFRKASAEGSVDMPVEVRKARGAFRPIAMRLVLIKKPSEAGARARAAAQKASRKDQRVRTDPRTLAGADHIILLTSLSSAIFSIDRIGALYRLRWQIELAFKRLKSIMHIDRLPAKDDRLARAWLHAHLLFAVLVDGAQDEVGAIFP